MKIELEIKRCYHCRHFEILDADGEFIDVPYCKLTLNELTDDSKICDDMEVNEFIVRELKETLGFKRSEIKRVPNGKK